MTLITAMKFSASKGAMVADERSAVMGYRQYDIANKLRCFAKELDKEEQKKQSKKCQYICVVGGSGASDLLY